MSSIGNLTINLDVNSAGYSSGMSKAGALARRTSGDISESFGRTNYSMMEARHGVMLLGEEFGVHMPRAVSTMIASIAPVGNIMAAAFPILGIVALVGILAKAAEHFDKAKEAAQAFGEKQLEASTKAAITTESLRLENLKLDDQLAKLSGGTKNTLQEELLAANKAALELADSLDKDNAAVVKSATQIGFWENVKLSIEHTAGAIGLLEKSTTLDVGKLNAALADATVRANMFSAAQQEMAAGPTASRRAELIQAIKDTQAALVKDVQAMRDFGGSTETVEAKARTFTASIDAASQALTKYGLEAQKAKKEAEIATGGMFGEFAVKLGQKPLPTTTDIPAGAKNWGFEDLREQTILAKEAMEGWDVLGKEFATTQRNDAEAARELTKEIKDQEEALKESESGYENSIAKQKAAWETSTKLRKSSDDMNAGLEKNGIIFGFQRGGAGKNKLTDIGLDVQKLGEDFTGSLVKGIEGANDSLAKFITTGQGGFRKVMQGMEEDLIRVGLRFAEMEALKGLFGAAAGGGKESVSPTGSSGGFLGALMSAFGGFRAGGGDVMPGKAYMVGENRPELFVPSMPGKIVPTGGGSSAGGGPMQVTIHQHVYGVRDPESFRQSSAQIATEAYRQMQIANARGGGY